MIRFEAKEPLLQPVLLCRCVSAWLVLYRPVH